MAIRDILKMGDARLLPIAEPVRAFDTPELHALIGDMFDTMEATDGAGPAAPQIGEKRATGDLRFHQQRAGQRIDSISIIAATQPDAERRLRQMYHHCEIIDCREQAVPHRIDTLDVEGVIGLISGAAANMPTMSVEKTCAH